MASSSNQLTTEHRVINDLVMCPPLKTSYSSKFLKKFLSSVWRNNTGRCALLPCGPLHRLWAPQGVPALEWCAFFQECIFSRPQQCLLHIPPHILTHLLLYFYLCCLLSFFNMYQHFCRGEFWYVVGIIHYGNSWKQL